MAAGIAPTLTARDSSQIFSASKVRSLLEHSKIWPIIFMDSLQAAQRSVHFLAYGYSYSSKALYKATTGRKMTERHLTGYVLLVPAVSWPDKARACVPHPWCVVGVQRFIFSSPPTASAPGSCTNPTSPPTAGIYPWGSVRPAGHTSHPSLHQQPAFPGVFPWAVWPSSLLPSPSLLWQAGRIHPLCPVCAACCEPRAQGKPSPCFRSSGVSLSNSFLSQWSLLAAWVQGTVPPGKGSCGRMYRATCISFLEMP